MGAPAIDVDPARGLRATFLGYRLAANEPGVTTLQAQTTAVMTLTWVGLLVLSIVAAPLNRWRLALVGAGPSSRSSCRSRRRSSRSIRAADRGLASIGMAALTWTFARFFVPEERPIGTRWRSEAA